MYGHVFVSTCALKRAGSRVFPIDSRPRMDKIIYFSLFSPTRRDQSLVPRVSSRKKAISPRKSIYVSIPIEQSNFHHDEFNESRSSPPVVFDAACRGKDCVALPRPCPTRGDFLVRFAPTNRAGIPDGRGNSW